jgi:hypothetical protein
MKLHELSVQGNWPAMGQAITDEMLDKFAVTGTHDELMPKVNERWKGSCDTVFIPIPTGADGAVMRGLVTSFHAR